MATKKAAPRRKVGRPTKYKPEYAHMALRHCLLGSDNAGLAALFKVDVRTISEWIDTIPEFSQAIYEGREGADAHIAASMYHRARGYSHPEQKVFNSNGEIITHDTVKHYPPDTQAASLWLRNRHPKLWRDKQEVEHSGSVDLASVLEQARKRAAAEPG